MAMTGYWMAALCSQPNGTRKSGLGRKIQRAETMLIEWLLLILIGLSAVSCFSCIVLASVHRREKPNRFARAAWICGACFALSVVACPVYTESHYMFIDEPFVDAARDGKLAEVKSLLA